MDICEVCGFDRDAIVSSEVIPRVTEGVASVIEVVATENPGHAQRPAPNVWSILEYAAHIRDAILSYRELIIAALAVEEPVKQKMYRDTRVDLGMYAQESLRQVADGLEVADRLFAHTYTVLTPEQLQRTAVCLGAPRTLLWVGANVVHEVEHHLADIQTQL